MPTQFWLGFPERFLVSLYPMGMVRQMSKDSFRSYWDFMQRMAEDLSQQYDDDTVIYLEQSLLIHWMTASIEYIQWFMLASLFLKSFQSSDSVLAFEWSKPSRNPFRLSVS